ncbi:PTS system N-acetylglucosamine-specific IIC component [Spiroplasma sabaudiense Ar-1343]|uniref:PTS system N-acetylglucosamine-specific IIC component n=1 Tax=Spiroplasma sabaudiense Ar-1343 TaxID=1276257 RepID=W6AJ72_9MOLU|nr:PTS transporter subunit EIIC [Spiroplasma sabaudiense]AHI53764.1 PTS system N-acetylglucosamine-specific IIC component [Spiroplasma sabaudiense Ar-1343]
MKLQLDKKTKLQKDTNKSSQMSVGTNSKWKNFWKKTMVGLQNLGKSLLFPIAVLPFAALLNRFGTLAIDLNPIQDGIKNAGWWVGYILQTPGKLVFDNIALLFAIGTAFGLSKDQRGEVALIGAVLYISLTVFLMEGGLTELFYKNVNQLEVWKLDDAGNWVKNISSGLSQLFYVPNFSQIDILGDGNRTLEVTGGTYILNIGVLGGIIAGVTSAKMYNRFSEIKLPAALSFFGGRRFVPMIIMAISLPIAFTFAIIWPWIQFALVKFGQLLSSSDAWAIPGSFLYALINRFAQPFGVHHILNTFLWFQLPIDGNVVTSLTGKVVLGEDVFSSWEKIFVNGAMTPDAISILNNITNHWATSVVFGDDQAKNLQLFEQFFSYNPNLIGASNGTIFSMGQGLYAVMGDINAFQKGLISGNFQTGFFPLYWGGLTGASVAMIMAADKSRRKELITFFLGIGIVAALTGIDEPIFFTFTFVAPILWVFNAIFTATFAAVAIAMHIHVGFGFSGGLIDYFISFANAWGQSKWEGVVNGGAYGVTSNPLWLLVLAVIMFPTYYFSFYFTIKKMDLQTPGREREEMITTDLNIKEAKGDDRYEVIADNLIEIIGAENILAIGNCSTRLRLNVKNNKVGTTAQYRQAGASGVVRLGDNGLQIIIGTDVQHVADAVERKIKIKTVVQTPDLEDK